MKHPIRILATSLLALAALASSLAGCGKGASPTAGLTGTIGATPAAVVTGTAYDAVAAALGAGDSLAPMLCGPLGLPAGIPSGCPWDAATSSFVCAQDLRRDGLVATHGYQFLDATGAAQTAYDAATTASIKFSARLTGTTTHGPWTTVDDIRSLVMSGLAGDETTRIFNGSGASTRQDSVRLADGTRALRTMSVTTTIQDVVVPKPWTEGAWPLSGSITTHAVVTGGANPIDLTGVLTFNGTRYATLTVGGTTYTIDLGDPPHRPEGGPGGAPHDSLPPPPPGGGGGGAPHDSLPPPPPGGGGGGAPHDSLPPPPPGGGGGGAPHDSLPPPPPGGGGGGAPHDSLPPPPPGGGGGGAPHDSLPPPPPGGPGGHR